MSSIPEEEWLRPEFDLEGNPLTDDANSKPDYQSEIEDALLGDEYRLGEVFRLKCDGMDVRSIASELSLSQSQVREHLWTCRVLIERRVVSTSPTSAAKGDRRLRRFLKRNGSVLSEETRSVLEDLADDYRRVSTGEAAIVREDLEVEEKNSQIPRGLAGIYVYTYPHYLKYPVLPEDDDDTSSRTYLKIGLSETDVRDRVQQQSTTSLPEPPIILRIYTSSGGDLPEIEARIHQHLETIDHSRVNRRRRGAGKEWFLTHLPCVDSTAELLGLDTDYSYEDDQS